MTVSRDSTARALSRRAFLRFDLAPAPAPESRWLRVHRVAMACRFEVVLPSEDARHVRAARAALDEADRIEALLTIFRDTSEVSRVNRAAADAPVKVSGELFALLRRCVDLHEQTGGAFDVTVSPLSRCWGFLQREGRLPAPEEIEAARALVSTVRLELDAEGCTVRFSTAGMELNFGGIGKGYALDCMRRVLAGHGVRDALLSAGGSSVLAIGGGPGGWTVDVRSPRAARSRLARLRLRDASLGTSGAGQQFVDVNGTRYGHVLDPRTGWSAAGVLSASLVTRDATSADALSTAVLTGGAAFAERYCGDHPGVMALVTPDDGSERPLVFGRADGATVEDA